MHRVFARLHQRLREYRSFDKRTQDCGRHREVRTPQLEEAVINLVEEQPTSSTRKIAFEDSELYYKAAFGKYEDVKDLLHNTNCNVDYVDDKSGGKTPLYIAASWGSVDHVLTVDVLLQYGANINLGNYFGNTPLYVAASWGNPDMVSFLLMYNADVNKRNKEGRTPLHIASCPKPHLSHASGIGPKFGVYVNSSTHVLFNAAKVCMSKILPDYSPFLDNLKNDYEKLMAFDNSQCIRIPDQLMEIVIYYNHFAVVVQLVEANANLNALDCNYQTPLDKALIWEHANLVKYLQANGAMRGYDL